MYIIIYHYRHPTGRKEFRAHPILVHEEAQAIDLQKEVAAFFKVPTYIVEFQPPYIKPKMELVKDGEQIGGASTILSRPTEGQGRAG